MSGVRHEGKNQTGYNGDKNEAITLEGSEPIDLTSPLNRHERRKRKALKRQAMRKERRLAKRETQEFFLNGGNTNCRRMGF